MRRYEKWLMNAAGLALIVGMAYVAYTQVKWEIPARDTAESAQSQEAAIPEPTNYAADYTETLTPTELQTLNDYLRFLDTGKHQFGVLIVSTTAPLSIEEYGIKVADKWKVGNSDKDNGAIIIIAKDDRKVRIEVGYGLEGDIPDSVAGRVIREDMAPLLKQGKYADAIHKALASLSARANR